MGNGRNFSLGNEFHWGPRRPAYAESFFLDFLPGQCRLIRRDGIRLFNIRYWANVLSPLTGRTTKRNGQIRPAQPFSRFWRDEQGH